MTYTDAATSLTTVETLVRDNFNRFGFSDRRDMAARIAETLRGYGPTYRPSVRIDGRAIEAAAYRAIGVTSLDLRTCEINEVRAMVVSAINAAR